MKIIKTIGVLTSGGDAPGMNAAIRAVVRACSYYQTACVGIYRGFQGMIEGDFERLEPRSVHNIVKKGGTVLKSARCDEFKTKEGRKKAYDQLRNANIDALIVIGGDGSFTGAMHFSKEFDIPVIGIPGTIDNDIFGTQYTIGYDTARNTAMEAIDKIRDTASSHNRLFFIEVMGRDAGFISLYSGVAAGAEEILIPEEDMGVDRLVESLKKSRLTGKTSSLVVVSEGDDTGENVYELAKYVRKNLPQYDVRVSVLGHMQRGGNPSCADRVLASRLGVKAVELLLNGTYNVMVGVLNEKIEHTKLEDAVKGKNKINQELLRISDIITI